jgi:lipoyl-dependent peroxiredoxin
MLVPTSERGFKLAVEFEISLPSTDDPELAAELVRAAYQVCPYSSATRGNVEMTMTVNGSALP